MNINPKKERRISCQSSVMWVGLSSKNIRGSSQNHKPLSPDTNSGKIIEQIEKTLPDLVQKKQFYKTNLVKFAPMDEKNKIRYPNQKEMDADFPKMEKEIKKINPKIIFLLGTKVANYVFEQIDPDNSAKTLKKDARTRIIDGKIYTHIHHPSYMYIYKRKLLNNYINTAAKLINSHA